MGEHTVIIERASSSPLQGGLKQYLPLYKAILKRNLEYVKRLCELDKRALEARITVNLDTALHVAVGTGKVNHIVKYLLTKMSKDQLKLKNKDGNTVLSIAAIVGNVKAAREIVKIQPELNNVANDCEIVPLIEAARNGHKEMIKYLMQFNRDIFKSGGECDSIHGVSFVNLLIDAAFYDLALEWVKDNRSLATTELDTGETLLSAMARKPSAFPSGRMDSYVIVEFVQFAVYAILVTEKVNTARIYNKVRELVELLCKEITTDYERASSMLKRPFLLAAESGVHEVVKVIIDVFPDAIWFVDAENRNALQLAVMNRREKVFNLIYEMSDYTHLLLMSKDNFGNNVLHLAGKLAPQNQFCGAALQTQHELQWFKGIEKIVQPAYKKDKNYEEKTPAMVFTEEHEELVKEGQKWMKDAASSCTVAAALIATIVFAAAITVPGGTDDDGRPILSNENSFGIFYNTNSFSLYTSIVSILIFLSVLTSRFNEADFLFVLPTRFGYGLFMLLCSLVSMMITSAMTASLMISVRRGAGITLVAIVIAFCAQMFTHTQFPLLMELMFFTRGPSIYRNKCTHLYRDLN
ncbi:ankyrin repeat-containing protein ITN1-like [Pistacia vera]|uniref:ankyrin repeat-containing protein ITN1-like n=1 Tax=Pistacia vera TaxID=55513 RepID=UPI001262D97D|nr:ankyrin repeat-containing protein ITN1-like [Pistacia vera]